LEFTHGNGVLDHFMAFTGTLPMINKAVGHLIYKPDSNFNSIQHVEILTIGVKQETSEEDQVLQELPLMVNPVNDQPEIVFPHHHILKMSTFLALDEHSSSQDRAEWLLHKLTMTLNVGSAPGALLVRGLGEGNITVTKKGNSTFTAEM
ncbi:unnamed protein product, partial [Discosporangium mesarthrocarpum]